MKNYKYATWITMIISFFSFILYTIFSCIGNEYFKNIFIGLFSSGILSFITSAIAYRQQRRDTLERFYNRTQEILHSWSKYLFLKTTEEKLDYFLEYCDKTNFEWDEAYGNMDFFFDRFRKKKYRQYIYDTIYCPILHVSQTICSSDCERYLRHYKMGCDNKRIFQECDKEFREGIEKYMLNDDTTIDVGYQLNHFFIRILYGKREIRTKQ